MVFARRAGGGGEDGRVRPRARGAGHAANAKACYSWFPVVGSQSEPTSQQACGASCLHVQAPQDALWRQQGVHPPFVGGVTTGLARCCRPLVLGRPGGVHSSTLTDQPPCSPQRCRILPHAVCGWALHDGTLQAACPGKTGDGKAAAALVGVRRRCRRAGLAARLANRHGTARPRLSHPAATAAHAAAAVTAAAAVVSDGSLRREQPRRPRVNTAPAPVSHSPVYHRRSPPVPGGSTGRERSTIGCAAASAFVSAGPCLGGPEGGCRLSRSLAGSGACRCSLGASGTSSSSMCEGDVRGNAAAPVPTRSRCSSCVGDERGDGASAASAPPARGGGCGACCEWPGLDGPSGEAAALPAALRRSGGDRCGVQLGGRGVISPAAVAGR
eukprot:366433-Chlamydomonas_euryale.AAC.3